MYKKLILSAALNLVFFAGDSLAEECNLTYKLQGDTYVVTGASNKSSCTEANIPATYEGKPVTSVGSDAFYGSQLTNVTIPNSVTSFGYRAFSETKLTNVTIPKSVTSIGDLAFTHTQLTSITIPDSVTYIGGAAFYDIPSSSSIDIQGMNPTISSNSFQGHSSDKIKFAGNVTWSCGADCSATLDKNGHVEFTGVGAMSGVAGGFAGYVTSVTIPDGITSVGNDAFSMTKITNVTIPDSVTSIGLAAFQYTPLTSVTIPNSVTSIGYQAFSNTKLTSITIPDSVTSIGGIAFAHTQSTSITIPDSVTSIGGNAFYNNPLTEIFCPKASVESGRCASMASAGNANVSKINFGYYEDDAMSDERVFYLKDENGVWKEDHRESIYEKYIADTGAVYLYNSKGNLKKMRGKKIYTVEEAEEATKNGNSFHVGLTYK